MTHSTCRIRGIIIPTFNNNQFYVLAKGLVKSVYLYLWFVLFLISPTHRYLREVDCSRLISLQKIHFYKSRVLVMDINKADRLTRQTDQGRQGHQMCLVLIPLFQAASCQLEVTNRQTNCTYQTPMQDNNCLKLPRMSN